MTSDDKSFADLPTPEYEGVINPDELEVDGSNPNAMDDEMFSLLCERIRTRGWVGNAIVTDTNGTIADGEHRWKAAKELDLAEVPVKQYALEDEERRLWRQELNKIHGEHDQERDALEFDLITTDDSLRDDTLDLLDAQDESLDEYLDLIRMDPPAKDVDAHDYDSDDLNVYFEDCVEGMAERVETDSVDCVITDPPYGIDFQSNHRNKSPQFDTIENDGLEDALDLFRGTAAELARVLRDGGHAYVFTRWDVQHHFSSILADNGLTVHNTLVWEKDNWGMGDLVGNYANQHESILYASTETPDPLRGKRPTTILEHSRVHEADYDHPTQKPVSLITDLITNSTDKGDRVLDPFLGSGTTAVAAIQNDRDYLGFELDADNYKPIIQRRLRDAIRAKDASVNHPDDAEAADDDNATADSDD